MNLLTRTAVSPSRVDSTEVSTEGFLTDFSMEKFIPQGYYSTPIPKSLEEWRKSQPEGGVCRDVWRPLEEFFNSHNYTLWRGPRDPNPMFNFYLFPPNDHHRAHDGFAYRTRYNKDNREIDRFAALVSLFELVCNLAVQKPDTWTLHTQRRNLAEDHTLPCSHI